MEKILIVGLGLIGGSIAKALKARTDATVLGADRDMAVLKAAKAVSAIDGVWDTKATDAGLVIVALSPHATIQFVADYADSFAKGTIVSDVCGVKSSVVAACEAVCNEKGLFFIGGHPMAGRECSGFANAVATLFEGRSYILTPTSNTSKEALSRMRKFALELGCATVTETTPEHHDKMIAYTSQLPHILAGAYIKSPTSEHHAGYSAGSFHDVSRVARVDEHLWSELFLENRGPLLQELNGLIARLEEYADALLAADSAALTEILRQARECKERDLMQNGREKPHPFG